MQERYVLKSQIWDMEDVEVFFFEGEDVEVNQSKNYKERTELILSFDVLFLSNLKPKRKIKLAVHKRGLGRTRYPKQNIVLRKMGKWNTRAGKQGQ